jgi:hypothetical protein
MFCTSQPVEVAKSGNMVDILKGFTVFEFQFELCFF